jgi:hypothetical protein
MSEEIQETQEIEVAETVEVETAETAEAETVAAESEVEEIEPPKRRPGRPKGKAKPKEPKTPRPKPNIREQVVEPPWDMQTFSRALATHLAEERRGARARRHQSWDGFFL